MWFKNLKIYRLSSPWTLVGEQLEETLARHAYQASGSAGANNLEMQSLAGCRRARTADWRTWWAGRSC